MFKEIQTFLVPKFNGARMCVWLSVFSERVKIAVGKNTLVIRKQDFFFMQIINLNYK